MSVLGRVHSPSWTWNLKNDGFQQGISYSWASFSGSHVKLWEGQFPCNFYPKLFPHWGCPTQRVHRQAQVFQLTVFLGQNLAYWGGSGYHGLSVQQIWWPCNNYKFMGNTGMKNGPTWCLHIYVWSSIHWQWALGLLLFCNKSSSYSKVPKTRRNDSISSHSKPPNDNILECIKYWRLRFWNSGKLLQ